MAVIAPVNLYFEDSGKWYSLPEWAEHFISVGKQLAGMKESGSRIVTAIIVPTRAFAAAFVSLGMVISEAASRDQTSATAHFAKLFDLPAGTPVIYRHSPGETLKGVLQAPEECCGKLYVKVQVHSFSWKGGGLTYLVDESQALKVQPALHSGKLPKKQGSKNSRFTNQFVDRLLGEADPVQLGLRSKFCCAIVGKKNMLEYEIRRTPLAIHFGDNRRAEGLLQDVLKVNRFVTASQSFHSALIPVGSEPPSQTVIANVEIGVVFDGAHGFLKWADMWGNNHQVIILDRTESYFDDAISTINARFSQNRTDGDAGLSVTDVPAGVEVLSFREALK